MNNNQLPPNLPPQQPTPQRNWNGIPPQKKGLSGGVIAIIVISCIFGLGGLATLCSRIDEKTSSLSSSATSVKEETNNKKIKTWELSEEKDPMSDKIIYFANLESDNEEQFEFPYQGGSRLILCIRKSPKYGDDVILKITNGQLLSSEFESNNQVSVRFDDKPAKKYRTAEPADFSPDQLFLRNAKDFINNAKTAKTIRIQIPIYQEGERIFNYRLDEPLKWEH